MKTSTQKLNFSVIYEVYSPKGDFRVDICGTKEYICEINFILHDSLPLASPPIKREQAPSFYKGLGDILSTYLTEGARFSNIETFHAFPFDTTQFTSFQRQCYNRALQIPFGETLTYGAVAQFLGNPRSARAVGGAMRANPFPLIIPCHRVVGRHGLGGFMGSQARLTLDVKETLLQLERDPVETYAKHLCIKES